MFFKRLIVRKYCFWLLLHILFLSRFLSGCPLLADPAATIIKIGSGNDCISYGLALDPTGDIVGTTLAGGKYQDGTVFVVDKITHRQRILAVFNDKNGSSPNGVTADAHGNLFGTTPTGGWHHQGVIYEIPWHGTGYGPLTLLAKFHGYNGGYPPYTYRILIDRDDNVFGVASLGGRYGKRVVYELRAGSHQIVLLASFNGEDGNLPLASLALWKGALYGTTLSGGQGYNAQWRQGAGTVFMIPNIHKPSLKYLSFGGMDGYDPNVGVCVDALGNVIGTAALGGKYGKGVLFECHFAGKGIVPLVEFDGKNGAFPKGPITQDAEGNIYGTTVRGGEANAGVLFELARHGSKYGPLQVLASFNGRPSAFAMGYPLFDSHGNIFGTTVGGGRSGQGMVYEVPVGSGRVVPLLSFNGRNGYLPLGPLTQDAQGDIYGVTSEGWDRKNRTSSSSGVIFMLPNATTGTSRIAKTQYIAH